MKPDLYTKAVLTVIALMLTVIACKTVTGWETTASAQSALGEFAGVQSGASNTFFDTGTGELFSYGVIYDDHGVAHEGQLTQKARLVKLGQPLVIEYKYDAAK
jgi:hypothetical protein